MSNFITNPSIGDKLFPVDNSWSMCLQDGSKAYLAGVHGEESNKVEIISSPFKMIPRYSDKEHSFVIVKFENKLYIILSLFYNSEEEMEIAVAFENMHIIDDFYL